VGKLGARIAVVLATILVVVGAGGMPARAQGPGPGSGDRGVSGGPAKGAPAISANSTTYKSFTVNGGYVAAGVSLRNRGKGTVKVSGIPKGAKVKAAYLFWSVLGGATAPSSFKKGNFKGHSITGTNIGSGGSPCWGTASTGYAYRASVKSWVKGNGSYKLKSFASGTKDGRDPFTEASQVLPLAEGASLVVVYKKSGYPSTRVVISNGYDLLNSSTATATLPFGFAASDPVGQVKTTFIGADGQGADEPASTVNGVDVPGATWDGGDPPVPGFSGGNLWDTQTIDAVNLVRPGDTSATMTVSGGPDCLVWVAQVLSIGKNGALDTDGDKLLDGWEANGYDANGDGNVDVPLPGANVLRKDLYVEMDYMGAEATCPCHLPLAEDLDRIVSVYDKAPQAHNPNGATGIALHLDAGSARGSQYDLGGGNNVPFDADLNPVASEFNDIKASNFSSARANIYYYMVWGHGYDGGTSSGNAFNIPNDSFLVTLGLWSGGGTSDQKVGTFVHEFGHDLGQLHGGTDNTNYKPNYLSVMNYGFQTIGVQRTGGRAPYFGYSSKALPTLNEAALNEKKGLRTSSAKTYRTVYACPGGGLTLSGRADKNIDWNCSGGLSSNVAANINKDDYLSKLKSFNNWGHIVYGGGAVGGGAISPLSQRQVKNFPVELTFEEAKKLQR
jgi:hypothetical protein